MINEQKRPKLFIPYSVTEKILEVASAFGVLINIVLLFKYLPIIPSTIPTHFGATGTPNAWGSKVSLLILPIVMVLLYTLLTILSRFPHIYNYITEITKENAMAQYHNARTLIICLKTEIIYTFTYIQWITINVALGKTKGLGLAFLFILLIIISGTVAYYILHSVKIDKK